MVLKLRSFGLLFACTTGLAVAGVVSAQPPAPTADRPHLAKDAKQAMDFLATWNCKHIANAVTLPLVYDTCRESGYEPPLICTPYELLGDIL